jgi:hypothetical protein
MTIFILFISSILSLQSDTITLSSLKLISKHQVLEKHTHITKLKKQKFIKTSKEIFTKIENNFLWCIPFDTITYKYYSLDTLILKTEINKLNLQTPLCSKLINFMKKNISKCVSVDESIFVLKRIIIHFNFGKKELSKHYKDNFKTYNYKKTSNSFEINDSTLRSDFILLENSLKKIFLKSINDPKYLSRNKTPIESKEEKARKREFLEKFEKWRVEQKKICANIFSVKANTIVPQCKMTKDSFLKALIQISDSWKKNQPILGEELKEYIIEYLANNDDANLNDCVLAMSHALSNIDTPIENIFINWEKTHTLPSYTPLKTKIVLLCNK